MKSNIFIPKKCKVLENKLHNLLSIDTKVEIEIEALQKEI